MNRGLARRTVFETRADIRSFLSLVARAVRDRRIEVHAFSILSTHFHFILRSLDGEVSESCRWMEQGHVQRFNRVRDRDGPLFRGRFQSIPVESAFYLQTLFRYIDQNAVDAGLVALADQYEFGSSRAFVGGPHEVPWLSRDLVDALVTPWMAQAGTWANAYRLAFRPRLSPAQRHLVEARIAHPSRDLRGIDSLVASAPPAVRAWMVERAHLADGTKPGLPLVDGEEVRRVVATHRCRDARAVVATGPRRWRSLWDLVEVALLRLLAGETHAAIARRLGWHGSLVHRVNAEHHATVRNDRGYADTAALVAHEVLNSVAPSPLAATGIAELGRRMRA